MIFVTHYPIDDSIANWYVVLDLLKKHNTQAVLCGHGHANHKFIFEGVPGVMGRSNLRASRPADGYNLVEVKDGLMSFSERIPGLETRSPWHSVRLERHDYAADTNCYPRPDFSVNNRFPGVKERWTLSTGYTIAGSPAVCRDCVIVGDASGTVRALALETGQARWTFKARNAVYSTPAVAQDLVVVPSTDGNVYALKADTGKLAWRFKTGRPIVASPAIAQGKVFLGSSEGKFRALDLASGKLAWQFQDLGGFVETRPLLHDGKVIFGAWDQYLYALDARTGELAGNGRGTAPGCSIPPQPVGPSPPRAKSSLSRRTGE